MSRALGPVALTVEPAVLVPGAPASISEATQRAIDEEVHRIVDTAHGDAIALLSRERSRLDTLAAALLESETLDQVDAYRAAGLEPPDRPPVIELAA
jgi:cell division protease FtsH